jgi:hypothetical protein
MSCKNCEVFQESEFSSWYRWENANIEIRGCDKHLKEIFEVLNKAQKKEEVEVQG